MLLQSDISNLIYFGQSWFHSKSWIRLWVLNELQIIVPWVWSKVVTDLSENKGECLNFVKMSRGSGDFMQNLDTYDSLFLVTFSEKATTLYQLHLDFNLQAWPFQIKIPT